MVKKIALFLCATLFLCGCSRSGPQDSPAEQDTTPSRHYTGYSITHKTGAAQQAMVWALAAGK